MGSREPTTEHTPVVVSEEPVVPDQMQDDISLAVKTGFLSGNVLRCAIVPLDQVEETLRSQGANPFLVRRRAGVGKTTGSVGRHVRLEGCGSSAC